MKNILDKKGLSYFLLANAILVSCHTKYDKDDGRADINKDSLTAEIIKLSSDDFQGRRPFTPGETKTVAYLSNEFKALGLSPGNGSSYFQEVPMVEISPIVDDNMKIESGTNVTTLHRMDDYIIFSENTDSEISLDKSELVFAGFGVVAPEYNWNDYAGLDVKNKVVLVLVNDPGFETGDTTIFKGSAMTYYGRWTYKFEEAARQGARGCLIIHSTKAASYPFTVIQNSWGKAQMHLDARLSKEYRCPVEGWITHEAAEKIFANAGADTAAFRLANQHGFKPLPLKSKISISMKINAVFNKSKNVIGTIAGSKWPDQYVVFTAHWDHFGIGKPEGNDSIYNGASDNASGTAALLELARAFKNAKTPPARTIVFLAVTAEEQGLLGSAYYAKNPLFPLEKTVANINTDVINSIGRMKDVEIVGAGQSEIEDYIREAAQARGRYIAPEPHPEAGHYFRSDHFNFAKAGVPALTLGSGVDHVEKGKEYGLMRQDEYTEKYYHRPADEYEASRWNLDGGVEDLDLLFEVGMRIANGEHWPEWKDGSEFKALRKK